MFALVLLGCLLLLVPDGRLLSRRARGVLLLFAIASAAIVTSLLLQLGSTLGGRPGTVSTSADVLRAAGQVAVAVGLVASAANLLVRLQRSTGETRQQLRWVAVAAAFLATAPLLALAINLTGRPTPVWVLLV